MNGVLWRRIGVIDEYVADEKATKKHFHVPATSLEALSAIRRRCRDMEAPFSGFHIGDVGVGVMWVRRRCWLGVGDVYVCQMCRERWCS